MADNTKDLAKQFTQMILDSIKLEEESTVRPRNQPLVAFQVKMGIKLRRRIKIACARKGIEQTQLTKHIMRQVCAVILEDEDPGLRQTSFLDD